MPAKRQFEIAGQAWSWIYRSLRKRGMYGSCDYEAKTVTICTSMNGLDRLDTELHEALHACQGFASEEHVTEVATTLATILWEIGYRLPGEHNGKDDTSA